MRRSLDVPRLECTHKAIVKVYDYPGRLIFKSFERRITCNKLEAAALRFGELAGAYRSIERPPQLAAFFIFSNPAAIVAPGFGSTDRGQPELSGASLHNAPLLAGSRSAR